MSNNKKGYILIANGPNLNLLGRRQPEIYGSRTLDDITGDVARRVADKAEIRTMQSNHEGDLVTAIQQAGFDAGCLGIVLNAGGYTHTSVAIADAIAAVPAPVVEVHISNIASREPMRHTSLLTPYAAGIIAGLGPDVYRLAVEALLGRET